MQSSQILYTLVLCYYFEPKAQNRKLTRRFTLYKLLLLARFRITVRIRDNFESILNDLCSWRNDITSVWRMETSSKLHYTCLARYEKWDKFLRESTFWLVFYSVPKVVITSARNTKVYKICKLRTAILSSFYNISRPNFVILPISRCSF